jgi:hypothetical protein
MKGEKRPNRLEDVELVPDAMERLERAVRHIAGQRQPQGTGKVRRTTPIKPKKRPRSQGG